LISLDCHVNLKGYQGAIEMVKREYSNKDTCVWTIVAPKGNKINITFTSFKISHSIIMAPIHQSDNDNSFTSSLTFNILNRYFQPQRSIFSEFHPLVNFYSQCIDTKLIVSILYNSMNKNILFFLIFFNKYFNL